MSPAACEFSPAAALKKRWPRASEISFGGSSRRLSQASPQRAELRGQGRALAGTGSPVPCSSSAAKSTRVMGVCSIRTARAERRLGGRDYSQPTGLANFFRGLARSAEKLVFWFRIAGKIS